MCIKTPVRKPSPKPKPERSVSWLTHVGFALGQLRIAVGGKAETYSVSPIDNDFGSLAVRMERNSDATGEASYDVLIDEQASTCTCPDATYRQHACKHILAVLALASHSQL